MADAINEKIKEIMICVKDLQAQVQYPVEKVDLADIYSDLNSILEKLENFQTYHENPNTDFKSLWETRKQETREFERARDAWIRTEIFTQLLFTNTGTQMSLPRKTQ